MKTFGKFVMFLSGMALSMAAAAAVLYKFFKKHCIIHIEFDPAEENSRACECENDTCEICNPAPEAEAAEEAEENTDEIEFELNDH